ncbi:unnamed protein product [Rhizoctonia solani]|uniref:DUF6535 domain-containing protein n=1 Tax=Rhizoctonia solani TaxID=456999 RepID=A0A8H3GVR8_9AGAM|nr:unnamed protein product [Rhizoctonia solani]
MYSTRRYRAQRHFIYRLLTKRYRSQANPTPQEDQKDPKKTDDNPKNNLAPNAEVWKTYVKETDRFDQELVDGWNNSLDMLLLFVRLCYSKKTSPYSICTLLQAALFSAISTAFVLESTQDLKPDYADTSAQALKEILVAVSSGNSGESSDVPSVDEPFSPTPTAIKVNILWFMSLSLSVAVALIAIVAKDWCYQFMSGRTGQALLQGRRRHLRWEGIEKWKMQEILYVLSLMLHAALLLFAVGLSVYLWDINPQVASPVVATTAAVGVFYVVTLFLPLFFRYCPFSTGLIKLFRPCWDRVGGRIFKYSLQGLGWFIVAAITASAVIKRCYQLCSKGQLNEESENQKRGFRFWMSQIALKECWDDAHTWVKNEAKLVSDKLMADRSQLDGQETPMDDVTSSMLGWMIAQCEDLNSVDIALRALVGAPRWLPRLPLIESGALSPTFARLSIYLSAWRYVADEEGVESEKLEQSVILQSQSLSFMSHKESLELPEGYLATLNRLSGILDHYWNKNAYTTALKELGNLSLHLSETWDSANYWREQRDRQWALVKMIARKDLVTVSLTDICHLVDGIAKSYIYDPDQSSDLLLELLIKTEHGKNEQLRRMIAIALAARLIASGDYPGCNHPSDRATLQKQARTFYVFLSTVRPTNGQWNECKQLLLFGLLGVLITNPESEDSTTSREIRDKALDLVDYVKEPTGTDHPSVKLPQDPVAIAINWLLQSTHISTHDTPSTDTPAPGLPDSAVIEIASPSSSTNARDTGHEFAKTKMEFGNGPNLEQAKQVLRLARKSFGWRIGTDHQSLPSGQHGTELAKRKLSPALDSIIETNLHEHVYKTIESENGDIIPHCMTFLWQFTQVLLLRKRNFKIEGDAIKCILGPLGFSRGDGPDDSGDMGFSELWIEKIKLACQQNPQNVLDSEILDMMILYHEYVKENLRPNIANDSDSESQPTWLSILQCLWQDCCNRTAQASSSSEPDTQGDRGEAPQVQGTDKGSVQEHTSQAVQEGELNASEGTKEETKLNHPPLKCWNTHHVSGDSL